MHMYDATAFATQPLVASGPVCKINNYHFNFIFNSSEYLAKPLPLLTANYILLADCTYTDNIMIYYRM